jgi:hypothetical protein
MTKLTAIFTHIVLPIVLGLVALLFGASVAAAQVVSGDLEVTFEGGTTLFSDSNIAPGYSVTRTVTVTNNGSDTESVYTSVENESSTGLADIVDLLITATSTGTIYFNDSFATFFGPDPVYLGNLGPGETRVYSYTATFDAGAGNSYQDKEMGFDLVIGFEGGSSISTGGGGGGGRSGSGSGTTLPEGQVAGESTTTNPFGLAQHWVEPIANFIRGAVLGESTTTGEEATGTPTTTEQTTGTPNRTSSPTALLIDQTYCTFWWLLLLALMSLGWSAYEDKYRNKGSVFEGLFARNLIFTVAYVALLIIFQVFGGLDEFWWLFAGAWAFAAFTDFRAHAALTPEVTATYRPAFFGGASAFFIATSFAFGFPCDWWPFLIVLVASGLVYLFEEV